METFTSEFVYHYDVALPTEAIVISGHFIRSSIIKRLIDMKCSVETLFIHKNYLYSYRQEAKDYVRIGLY